MIKTIIKRDGTEEDYTPSKVNGWGEWGAEHLGERVDWSTVVLNAVSELPEKCTSQQLQLKLIEKCLDMKTWSAYRMAGRLYAAYLFKHIFNDKIPTVKEQFERMASLNLMAPMNFSDEEYAFAQEIIDHDRDYYCPHFSLHHSREKYQLKNRVTGEEYETQQFMYMRMAMAMAEDEKTDRMVHMSKWYEHLSGKRLSAPTPNYVDFGTPRPGLASCCLLVTGDDGQSLAITDYIANIMTQANAGIGVNLITRSIGDPVRNGTIKHLGKLSYINSLGKSIKANTKNGRGGAGTLYFNAYDPEANFLAQLRNPRQTEDKRNRDLHYNMIQNKWFQAKVAKGDPIFTWNCKTAPDLHAAFYGKDINVFIELYKKYEQDHTFKKNYIQARELALTGLNEAYEVGVSYLTFIDEINRHTPYLEPIFSSNLCAEITQPTGAYYKMEHVYSEREVGVFAWRDANGTECWLDAWRAVTLSDGSTKSAIDLQVGDLFTALNEPGICEVVEVLERTPQPEVSMCSLAAACIDNIENDAQYAEVMYYAYKMIDYAIGKSIYPLPHVGFTAKQRMNAGVGIMGLATHMARAQLPFSSIAGKKEIHFVAERHMWHATGASLKIAKERGNAPWIHKTAWPKGWLPIDTYNKGVDKIADFENIYPWEKRRAEIIAQGGLAHSSLVAYMPGESSSKAIGATNSIYAARRLTLKKTDNHNTICWAAPYGDDPAYKYQLAWDIPTRDQIDVYAIFQKWTDQAISADLYRRIVGEEKIDSQEMIGDYLYMGQRGLKTRYYMNVETSAGLDLNSMESAVANFEGADACAGGACSL